MPSPYYRPNPYNEDNPDPRAEGAYGLSTVRQFPTNLIQKLTMGAIQLGRNIVGAPAPMVFGGAGTNGLTPPPGAANPTGGIAMDANYGTGGEGTSMILPGSAGNPPQIAPPPTPDKGPWFGPGTPLSPMAPPADVAGREFDYPNSYNIGNTPRQYEAISFWQLRQVADLYTIVRILIEACKDQMETVTGSFLPMQVPGETDRKAPDARCQQLENFFKYPDGRTPYNTWKRELLEEMYVIDAPAMYVRRDMMNRPARLEIMKGDYIMPLIDTTGRVPEPPMVAFKQITKGVPAIYYRADELIYWPRNRRAGHVYAASPVEQMIGIINIGMRREAAQLGYFADGNIPDALISVPAAWSPEDISRHQKAWDARMRDPQRRFGKITYIPGGGQPVYTRNDQQLFGQFDEWLARVACYCFKKPPTAFVQQNNRATAESAKEEALEDGLASVMIWWKSLKDHVAQKVFGFEDIEFVYDDRSDIDPMEMIEKYLPAIQQGGFSWDEIRGKMGMSPIGLPHTMYGMGPLGAMLVTDFLKASAQGLGIPQPAPAVGPDGMPLAASPGQPALATPAAAAPPATPVAAPDMSDPLSGVPAELLAAVGLGPAGEKGRSINITAKDEHTSDPLHRAVAHPQVLKTLRAAEAAHNAKFGGKKPDNAKGITPGKKAAPPQRSVKGSPVGVADGQKGSYAHAH